MWRKAPTDDICDFIRVQNVKLQMLTATRHGAGKLTNGAYQEVTEVTFPMENWIKPCKCLMYLLTVSR